MTYFLEGDRAGLRPLERDDYAVRYLRWLSDEFVTEHVVRGTFPRTAEEHDAAYDARARSDDVEMAVVRRSDDLTVGIAGLHSVQWVPRHAEFRVLIGERSAWGEGIGREVLDMLLAYAFDTLQLNKVWLGVNSANHRALTTYERAGFVREGVLRQEIYRRGRYHDAIRMSLLASEYRRTAAERTTSPS